MAKWRVYYTTGFLSCSIVWSFLPSLVYRLSNMTEMQATVICNFFKKKDVHNLVTDFLVFLDLFTRKKKFIDECTSANVKKNATNHCEILYQFLSLLPPPFFPFLCLCFLPFFFTFSWFFNTSLPGIFTLPLSFNSMLILVVYFCHLVEKYLLSLCSISLKVS